MERHGLKIGELSELFQIPESTLRFWEDEGLIHSGRDSSSGYRLYSLKNYLEVCEVSFFRSMGVSVSELGELSTMGLEDLSVLLASTEEGLDGKIAALARVKGRVEDKRRAVAEIERLRSAPFRLCAPGMAKLISDPLFEAPTPTEPVQDYKSCAVFFSRRPEKSPRYALVVPTEHRGENVIWERDPGRRYAECLLEVSPDEPEDNNRKVIERRLAGLGFKTGAIAGRYLATAFDKRRYEYYQAWAELE